MDVCSMSENEIQLESVRYVRPDWIIRTATPQDFEGVRDCFETSYQGCTVDLRSLLESETAHVYVAELTDDTDSGDTGTGEIIGTMMIKHDWPGERAEGGRMVIHSEYQGLTCEANRSKYRLTADLWSAVAEDAIRNDVRYGYTDLITTHAKTQRFASKGGFVPMQYQRQKMNDIFGTGREGSFRKIQVYKPFPDAQSTVYVPDKDVGSFVESALSSLDHSDGTLGRSIERSSCETAVSGLGLSSSSVFGPSQRNFTVTTDGKRTGESVCEAITDAAAKPDRDYVGVHIPTDIPELCTVVSTLRSEGFDVSGYLPSWSKTERGPRDLLVLQRSPDSTRQIEVIEPSLEFLETLPWTDEPSARATPHDDVDGVYKLEI